MTAQERVEVILAYYNGEIVQYDRGDGVWRDWWTVVSGAPSWGTWARYNWRIKPEHEIKPSINWDHVSEEFNYLVMDAGGDVWLHIRKPEVVDEGWASGSFCVRCEGFSSLVMPKDFYWEKSLISRFDKEENDES